MAYSTAIGLPFKMPRVARQVGELSGVPGVIVEPLAAAVRGRMTRELVVTPGDILVSVTQYSTPVGPPSVLAT